MSVSRVVITGLGIISPVGLGVPAFGESLRAGKSGVHTLRLFDPSLLSVRFGGEIEEFDAREYLEKKDRKALKMMVRTIQLAVAAARLALDDAGLKPGTIDPTRLGVTLGTGCIPGDLADLGPPSRLCLDPADDTIDIKRWGREGLTLIPPMWMLNHVPNMPASHVSILNDAQGPNNTITQFDAAALLALGEAYRVVQRGAADAMLAGGTDTRTTSMSVVRNILFGRLSHRNDEPERACRPFDRDRDGQVLGEGSGVLVLEDLEHASKRGANVWGEIVGFGAAFDRGVTGRGLIRAIQAALTEANITPEDLDHVNAHAGGFHEDASEARALGEILGREVGVFAPKSYLGNAGNGASGLELAASLVALRDGVVPATLNCDNLDPDCPIEVIREPRPVRRRYVLKLASTDRGQCGALVVRREG